MRRDNNTETHLAEATRQICLTINVARPQGISRENYYQAEIITFNQHLSKAILDYVLILSKHMGYLKHSAEQKDALNSGMRPCPPQTL